MFHLQSQLISFWKVKDPERYPVTTKPAELNLYSSGPHTRTPGQGQNAGMPMYGQPQQPMALPSVYGFFPLLYHPAHALYPQPPSFLNQNLALPGPIHTGNLQQPVRTKTEVPKIHAWLKYCDKHPDRGGENFSAHAGRFDDQGYHRINQLTGERMSAEKLSDWLAVGKGTADLLIQYAGEDMELVNSGLFSMELADGFNTSSEQHNIWN